MSSSEANVDSQEGSDVDSQEGKPATPRDDAQLPGTAVIIVHSSSKIFKINEGNASELQLFQILRGTSLQQLHDRIVLPDGTCVDREALADDAEEDEEDEGDEDKNTA